MKRFAIAVLLALLFSGGVLYWADSLRTDDWDGEGRPMTVEDLP